jgi:hypothetical protein
MLQKRGSSVRRRAYLCEHVFPRLRHRIGTAALDRLDVLIELSTLGEYGLGEDGRPLALAGGPGEPAAAWPDAAAPPSRHPRLSRDQCPLGGRPGARRCDAPAAP